jgi:hypothetical protein
MTWRSFWNGPDGADGPISWAWNVMGWPTVYVIDAKGVIRAKNVREKEMDKAVDGLLKEMGVPEEKNGEKKEKKDDKKLCWFSGNGSDGLLVKLGDGNKNCEWIYRFSANPGRPWGGIVPPSPVLAPGAALGSRPRVALSSAQAHSL